MNDSCEWIFMSYNIVFEEYLREMKASEGRFSSSLSIQFFKASSVTTVVASSRDTKYCTDFPAFVLQSKHFFLVCKEKGKKWLRVKRDYIFAMVIDFFWNALSTALRLSKHHSVRTGFRQPKHEVNFVAKQTGERLPAIWRPQF